MQMLTLSSSAALDIPHENTHLVSNSQLCSMGVEVAGVPKTSITLEQYSPVVHFHGSLFGKDRM